VKLGFAGHITERDVRELLEGSLKRGMREVTGKEFRR